MVQFMKNYLIYMMRSEGFILVHVLFIISLLFLLVSSSIASYHSDLYITDRQIEQIQAETLFQMSRSSYLEEQQQMDEVLQETNYQFPDGRVEITLLEETEEYLKLNFHVVLEPQEAWFSINHLLEHDFQTD